MDFEPNKLPREVIKEGDIYPVINDKWFKNSWKELDELKKVLIKCIFGQMIMMLMLRNIK